MPLAINDRWQIEDLPGGAAAIDTWYSVQIEVNTDSNTARARFGLREGEWNEWTNSKTMSASTAGEVVRFLGNNPVEYDNISMAVAGSSVDAAEDFESYAPGDCITTSDRWSSDASGDNDGSELGSYNTQQHWVTHSDGLFLVYTRKGADNENMRHARHRAPLLIARVDTETMQVIRKTERVLMPNRGRTLGNFGVMTINQNETWITASECFSDSSYNAECCSSICGY